MSLKQEKCKFFYIFAYKMQKAVYSNHCNRDSNPETKKKKRTAARQKEKTR
nr:MAG TPA: hypothetical protein [Caudoviricetes sp.]